MSEDTLKISFQELKINLRHVGQKTMNMKSIQNCVVHCPGTKRLGAVSLFRLPMMARVSIWPGMHKGKDFTIEEITQEKLIISRQNASDSTSAISKGCGNAARYLAIVSFEGHCGCPQATFPSHPLF